MKLTARARSKSTHKGTQDVVDEVITDGKIVPRGAGLSIKLTTQRLSLSGRFVANLHLDWEEIELLAKIAADIPADQRRKLLEIEIDELNAEMERWRRKIPPTEGEE